MLVIVIEFVFSTMTSVLTSIGFGLGMTVGANELKVFDAVVAGDAVDVI